MFTRGSGGGGPVAVMDLGLGCFHLAIDFVLEVLNIATISASGTGDGSGEAPDPGVYVSVPRTSPGSVNFKLSVIIVGITVEGKQDRQ